MNQNLKNAAIASLLAGVIIAPVYGLQILRRGQETYLQPDWKMIIGGMLAVFVVQLLNAWLRQRRAGKAATPSRFNLPAITDKFRHRAILVLVLFALVWPFFTGRAQVDIATLVLIYVMLGLGLNIVVGFAGLLDLGFVGFYATGAYTYALLYHWAGWGFWEALPFAGLVSAFFGFILGFPGVAAAGRLSGDRDPGLRRNHPPAAHQPDQFHRRAGRHFGNPQAFLLRLPDDAALGGRHADLSMN